MNAKTRRWRGALVTAIVVAGLVAIPAGAPVRAEPVSTTSIHANSPRVLWSAIGNRLDVFDTGRDGDVYQKTWIPAGWGNWFNLGSPPGKAVGPPGVSWTPNSARLDVFSMESTTGRIYQKFWTGATGWSGWVNLGAVSGGFIYGASASWRDNGGRLDIFSVTWQGHLIQAFWNPTGWSGWIDLGMPPGGIVYAPTAMWSPGGGRLDVFADGGDGNLYQKVWTPSGWSGWTFLGSHVTGTPAATWTANGARLDVFSVDSGNELLYQKYWTAGGWSGWYDLEAPLPGNGSGPGAAWHPSGARLDVFINNSNGQTYQQYWTPQGWSGWIGSF